MCVYRLVYVKTSSSVSIGGTANGIVILAPNASFPSLFPASSFAACDLHLWLVQSCASAAGSLSKLNLKCLFLGLSAGASLSLLSSHGICFILFSSNNI